MNSRLLQSDNFYYGLFAVLLVPALLINLGAHHIFIHTDESLRALIALEMLLNDEFIAPTVNGLYYYNKPPLYNWIIVGSYKLFGEPSLFALRFPVVVAIFLYGFLIVRFIGKATNRWTGWLVAIMTITSGRILFYDSFLGLIDIAFSAVIFTNFMLFYHFGRQKRYFALFALTYFLSAIAYLMKGLPPIVFQGFTIIAFAIYIKNWKILFHRMHFLGALFFIIPVGLYYFAYMQVNAQSILNLFETLWTESSKRTVTDHGILDTLKSLYEFPLENLYHFAPWTIFVVFLFRRGALKSLWRDVFGRYVVLVFGLNILVYWTSPGVHPRYLFMFLPLLFVLLAKAEESATGRSVTIVQMILMAIMIPGALAPWFAVSQITELGVDGALIKMAVLSLVMAVIAVVFYRQRRRRWIILGIFLLVVRIGFDWFVLPNRDLKGAGYADAALEVARITEGKPLYIAGPNYVHSATSFMIERERGEVLELRSEIEPGAFYLAKEGFKMENADSLLTFGTRGTDLKLILYRMNE
ncbi:MAG TPA: hypothetical protein VJ949_00625 [Cryomorphaceae bacterium]|nr:hypothetical protein [Cryomorphaceae bacterium]